MQYIARTYQETITIEADRVELKPGHTQTSGLGFSGGSSNTWTDAVFYRTGDSTPVAFVHQPYSVREAETSSVDAKVKANYEV